MLHWKSKTRNNVIVIWLIIFSSLYYIYNRPQELEILMESSFGHTITTSTLSMLSTYKVDAIVYIAMGKMAAETTLDQSILSLRQLGKYRGPIFIITDSSSCFKDIIASNGIVYNNDHNSYITRTNTVIDSEKTFIKTIDIPSETSIIKIKSLKTQILKLLPLEYKSIVYLDVDILVTKPLHSFIYDTIKAIRIGYQKWQFQNKDKLKNTGKEEEIPKTFLPHHSSPFSLFSNKNSSNLQFFDIGAFYDANAHYVGFCDGCEKWHTGILLYQRGHGEYCLKSWGEILLSGKYDTDQESLDEAERIGACQTIIPFANNHILFAKDYIGWFFTSGHSFIHVTAAGRLQEQVRGII